MREKRKVEMKRMLSKRVGRMLLSSHEVSFVQMARFELRGFRRRPQASRNPPSRYPATVSPRKIFEPQPGVNPQASS